ncbi:hypothetical protein BpHYR1_036130 [Brachionus plicatilis]|uniref:Uncharacterized protein n=1 Tax=Brachionus plicatilis TaxID=10195 RepID=A0A3M7S5Y5_BRAPC|nr:hypothetical protein BpHYR1_036130 [Brachionus plicatilis]
MISFETLISLSNCFTYFPMKRLSWALILNTELAENMAAGLCSTSTSTSISACIFEPKPSSKSITLS